MIYEDDEVEVTDEEIQALYDKALTVALTNEDSGWIHVPISPHNALALCGRVGEPAFYFAAVYDFMSDDICAICAKLKVMES